MPVYQQIIFKPIDQELSSILIALLSEEGFDGFEEAENSLSAFIPADKMDESCLQEIASRFSLEYQSAQIAETNWNALWESGFDPVIVDNFLAIRAHFHTHVKGVEHEIIITPKMSFGTGHHATTYLMVQAMREIDFIGKTVLDFGTGTGILAILAEKLGALKVLAIDYDDWSIDNSRENIQRNQSVKIDLLQGDTARAAGIFDIVLANINRQVIIDNIPYLKEILHPGGLLLLSGLLLEDEQVIRDQADLHGLVFTSKSARNGWISLQFYC